MTDRDWITIEVDGQVVDAWTEYQVDSDILTAADGFSLKLRIGDTPSGDRSMAYARVLDLCLPNKRCTVHVGREGDRRGRVKILAGIIDEVSAGATQADGTGIDIDGRDVAAYLVDSHMPVDTIVETDTLFLDLVRAAVAPWDLEVTSDGTHGRQVLTGMTRTQHQERRRRERAVDHGIAERLYSSRHERAPTSSAAASAAPVPGRPSPPNLSSDAALLGSVTPIELARLRAAGRYANKLAPVEVEQIRIRDARPRPGESVWAFIERHARRFGLMLWADPDGRIVVSSPNYQSPVRGFLRRTRRSSDTEPNNILAGGVRINGADRFGEVRVYGRARGRDVSRSRIYATASDPNVPFTRLHVMHDASIRDQDEADRLAQRTLAHGAARTRTFDYTVQGHAYRTREGPIYYAPDTVLHVYDDVAGIDEDLYVVRRTFAGSKEHGTTTRLILCPKGGLAL